MIIVYVCFSLDVLNLLDELLKIQGKYYDSMKTLFILEYANTLAEYIMNNSFLHHVHQEIACINIMILERFN